MKVYVSAGHSANDSGAVKKHRGWKTIVERDEVWEISNYVAAELKKRGIKAYRDKWLFGWRDCVKAANRLKCDLFVEFHENAGGGDGAEVIIYSKKTQYIADAFKRQFLKLGQGWRKTIIDPRFWVIRDTKMPACIVEVAFVDNKKDIKDFDEPHEKKRLAVHMANAIEEILKKSREV